LLLAVSLALLPSQISRFSEFVVSKGALGKSGSLSLIENSLVFGGRAEEISLSPGICAKNRRLNKKQAMRKVCFKFWVYQFICARVNKII
jgi:hypothetical protein